MSEPISFYNEIDPFAADWLENLIADGLIPPGVVDRRDIRDIRPSELERFTQCHFFAGIGGWSYALQLAGIPRSRRVWTGSCPCQPFSQAGKSLGFADERHLWPSFFHLIDKCRPATIFGEQVASKAGLGWLDLVRSDLEGAGYSIGAADLCAAGVGAPHIRQRLWFVGYTAGGNQQRNWKPSSGERWQESPRGSSTWCGSVAYAPSSTGRSRPRDCGPDGLGRIQPGHGCLDGELADSDGRIPRAEWEQRSGQQRQFAKDGSPGAWSNVEWLQCRDGKARPTKPGIFPLAHGVPNRVGTLRGAGNAIVSKVGAEMIMAFEESRP